MNPAGGINEGVNEAVQNVIKVLESQIDEQLERLESPDEDELANIRASRIKELKQRQSNQRKWVEAVSHTLIAPSIQIRKELRF